MCGIVGYVGSREAAPILLNGLNRLEYRGYDSAGVVVQNGVGLITRKVVGRVSGLESLLSEEPACGTSGIGHTRWATHGAPTQVNAHPHTDCTGRLALVHNGIIENADVLRTHLENKGHVFRTETDTEVIVHLIEDTKADTLEERVAAALGLVVGAYAIAVMSADEPGRIVVARRGSPVLIGVGEAEYFIGSDPSAVVDYTRQVVYLDDGDIAVLTADGMHVVDHDARVQVRSVDRIDWSIEAIERGNHAHFMHKEIHEQPESARNTMRGRLGEDGNVRLDGLKLTPEQCRRFRRVLILGCGTSWHAGLIGRQVIERLTGLPVQVEYASEYRYQHQLDASDTLAVAISQSGETADTLEAMRAARAAGAHVVGIVNVVGSTIARDADGGIYLHVGPEVGVASTKAFTSQIIALLMLGVYLGRHRDLAEEEAAALLCELDTLPSLIRRTLRLEPQVEAIAASFAEAPNALYLGRGVNFPVALEGALKLKEISYIHAEGLPAAEMKHGPIALIDENMPVVFVAPSDEVYEKVVSNIQEVKARGGRILVIGTEGNGDLRAIVDHQLNVPRTSPMLSPLLTVIPLQLLAYHIAVLRGCDVDRPRNLAKSVTVE
ncbi:MAG TPA: glutamine--fructose-6-phosphate transaminase (isomerizing) [Longimicrobiales bacterium]|nr:glutamine--fructose-6-phosphate transaminase (isomerizing) [Longimicrobiales bacterium]